MNKEPVDRIIILTNTLKSGGAEKQSILLAKALKDEYDILIIVYYGSEFDIKLKNLTEEYKLNVIWLEGSHIMKMISLFRIFRKNMNSAIFSYLATTNFMNAIIGSIAGVPIRIGGIRNAKLSKTKMHIQKLLHNKFLTCSVFNNYRGKEDLCSKGFDNKKAVVIHNCIEISIPPKTPVKLKTNYNIITVGRFVEQKDYFTSINAFAHLLELIKKQKKDTFIKYYIIGYGHQENEIRNYISMKNLNNNIKIVVNPPDISNYYAIADIYLSTSIFEGLSNSIMEALAYSLPVVATDVGDNNFLIKQGETGYLTKTRAIEEIASCLSSIILDDEKRITMGMNGYRHLKDHFSAKTFKQNYLDLIQRLNNERQA